MRKIKVELGSNSYDIYIGTNLGEELKNFIINANFSKMSNEKNL